MKKELLATIGLGLAAAGTLGLSGMAFYLNNKWYESEVNLITAKRLMRTYLLTQPVADGIKKKYNASSAEEVQEAGGLDWEIEYVRQNEDLRDYLENKTLM